MNSKATYIPYDSTHSFSNLVCDFVNKKETLTPFLQEFPSKDSIRRQIERKAIQPVNRELLYQVIQQQYQHIEISTTVHEAISKLKEPTTFTICTAHQPSVFTGHLYFIYKTIHAIKLARECKELYPDFQFVPVFYIGSEDNDIDEIGTLHYDEKTYHWNSKQTGACGRMLTTELIGIRDEIKKTLNALNPDELSMTELLDESYNGINTLAEATRIMLNGLFGKYGLVVLDGDDRQLKQSIADIIKQEIFFQSSEKTVLETIEKLNTDYKIQANPRTINLFYLKDEIRERIMVEDQRWQVMNTTISFTREEIEHEIDNYPERFSPNVILRPLYQERILPNIAFIGGGGELAYWLELKSLFESHHIVYPLIFLRNSVLWIHERTTAKMNELSLTISDLFLPNETLFKALIQDDVTLIAFQKNLMALEEQFTAVIGLGANISPSLEKSMLAHRARAKRIEDRMKQKFLAALKKREEISLHKIEAIKDHISPNGQLQERHDTMLSIFKLYGYEMFEILIRNQQAFGMEFLVLST